MNIKRKSTNTKELNEYKKISKMVDKAYMELKNLALKESKKTVFSL